MSQTLSGGHGWVRLTVMLYKRLCLFIMVKYNNNNNMTSHSQETTSQDVVSCDVNRGILTTYC